MLHGPVRCVVLYGYESSRFHRRCVVDGGGLVGRRGRVGRAPPDGHRRERSDEGADGGDEDVGLLVGVSVTSTSIAEDVERDDAAVAY